MRIKKLKVQNFRNIAKYQTDLHADNTLIVAPNATGKTNLLEAISMISYGRSIKAKKQTDLFRNGNDKKPVIIEVDEYMMAIQRTNGSTQKVFKIDKAPIQYSKFVGRLVTLFFTTSTIDLLSRSPSTRRRFLDRMIWLISPEYRKSLGRYEKALRNRNAVLENRQLSALEPWTTTLLQTGSVIIQQRHDFFDKLGKELKLVEKGLSIGFEPSIELSGVFDESAEERFGVVLEENRNLEIRRGRTLAGPHRDDWTLLMDNHHSKDLRSFGSRGEQRMAILSMFIAILQVIGKTIGSPPILLLDDLFSELDQANQKRLLDMLSSDKFQVIATTTPNTYHDIKSSLPKPGKIKVIELDLG